MSSLKKIPYKQVKFLAKKIHHPLKVKKNNNSRKNLIIYNNNNNNNNGNLQRITF